VRGDGGTPGATPSADLDELGDVATEADKRQVLDGEDAHDSTSPSTNSTNGNGADRVASQEGAAFELKREAVDQPRLFDGDDGAVTVPCPDPRTAPPRQVREALVAIVRKHGPMPCHYAYRLYARSAGINLGKNIKKALNRAMAAAVRAETLEQTNEYNTNDQANQIVRAAGIPTVRLRPRGERNLEDIPPSELAAVMQQVITSSGSGQVLKEDVFREVLNRYELTKLTQKAQSILEIAWNMRGQDASKKTTEEMPPQ
jgi:hypothetical protein